MLQVQAAFSLLDVLIATIMTFGPVSAQKGLLMPSVKTHPISAV